MPKTLVIPLQLSGDGTFLTTEDPSLIMKQRITDILATSRWERVHRVNHGCDLEEFLFTNVIEHLLAAKSNEIMTTLRNSLSYGDILQVMITPIRNPTGIESAVMVEVLYRALEGGEISQVSETFATNPEDESV
jgi:phage baseplate assembly protein W